MAYIFMLKPSSIFLSLFLDKWTPASPNTQSLPNAGQWIGYIERILILTFVLIGSIEGAGFLLAAKSVFRFGELNKAVPFLWTISCGFKAISQFDSNYEIIAFELRDNSNRIT